jgi:peptidoglycan/xylan/chitin deacetylase (PgdA/CDA1 family)
VPAGAKAVLLNAISRSGVGVVVRNSAWRARRLLVLCWHGISLDDEHRWRPGLYVSPVQFRKRLEMIRATGCTVVSLPEALERLKRNELPPRSVAITFDDGFHDFYARAAPVLSELGFPATIYLTTFYVDFQKPIFEAVLSYLLWKGCGRDRALGGGAPLATAEDARAAFLRLIERARRDALSSEAKDDLARSLASQLGFDYDDLLRRRVLHLMSPAEVRALSAGEQFSFQLHTHRHRTPEDPGLFGMELAENQERIRQLTGYRPTHFCYPGGAVRANMFPALERAGIRSAVTCRAGLADAATHPYLLPRILDVPAVDDLTFQAWLDGTPGMLQRPTSRPNGAVPHFPGPLETGFAVPAWLPPPGPVK